MVKQAIHFTGENSNRANAAFMLGAFTILAALALEYIGGFIPCELCLGQRIPYYVGLPLLAFLIAFWRRIPAPPRIAATLVIMAIFLWGTYLGAYHAGVEWGFWPGPTACTGTGDGISFNDLGDINAAPRVIPCDEVQLRIAGISLAGYNALICLIISGLLGWSVLGQYQRWRREGR